MILSRVKISPQQRYDLEDFVAGQSACRTDAKLWTKAAWSELNLIQNGFTVSGIGLNQATVAMTDAALIFPQNSFDFSYFVSAPGDPDIVIPDSALVDNARNYVEAQLQTQDGVPLTKAFWDPEANSGLGLEFNQIVNTITDLKIAFVTSTGGFSGLPDRLPVAIIDTNGSGVIKIILDRRNLFGRLAKPNNLDNQYAWGTKIEPTYALTMTGTAGTFVAGESIAIGSETATVTTGGTTSIAFNAPTGVNYAIGSTVTGGTSGATGTLATVLESFVGVDKSLNNQKKINDALMTEFAKVKGTRFWWTDAPTSLSGLTAFTNSLVTPLSSGAKVNWNGSVLKISDASGAPASTDNVAAIRIWGNSSTLNLRRQDGTGSTATLAIADGQVLFVQLPAAGTSRNYTGGIGGGATNYQVAARAAYVQSDTNYWLAYREGTKLFFRGTGELSTNETTPIGDNIPQTLLDNIGLTDEVTAASYSSDIRGTASESIVARVGKNTDALGDEQEDRSAYFRSDNPVTWTGTQLQFTTDIVLDIVNTKSGTLTSHTILAANSPITLNNLESVYIAIARGSSSENVSPVRSSSVAVPAQTQANKDIFILARRKDAGGTGYLHLPLHKQVLSAGQTVRLGASGAGSGSGAGTDLSTLQYRADITDDLSDQPLATNSTVGPPSTGVYSAATKSYALSYDASKTITANSGTTMHLSATPAYTVQVGDVVRIGTTIRNITALGSINSDGGVGTPFTIASAFPSNPSATACTVSQSIWTVDLNNTAFDGVAASSQYTDSISDCIVTYNDTASGVLFNGTDPANVGFVASADGTNITAVQAREANVPTQAPIISLPTSGSQLWLTFFSNKTSGSGTVNLVGPIRYYFSREVAVESSGLQWQAFALSDASQLVGCTLSTVAGKTRITITGGNTYPVGVASGNTNGPLMVFVNGQKVPRFVNSSVTPATNSSYTEVATNIIDLDTDYSPYAYPIEVYLAQSVVDSNTQNTTNISAINTHRLSNYLINANFDFWQRGTSFATPASATYTADRFRVAYDGTIGTFTVSQQAHALGQVNVPNEPTYFYRWAHTVAGSASTIRAIQQRIEGVRTLAGKQATVTLWAKADATRTVAVGFTQSFGTGGSPSSDVVGATQNIVLTTNWQPFTLIFAIPSVAGKTLGTGNNDYLQLQLSLPLNVTMTIDLSQVNVNEGSIAAPWSYASGGSSLNSQAELALCQRYYEKSYDVTVAPATVTQIGRYLLRGAAGIGSVTVPYRVSKRAAGTVTTYNPTTGASGGARDESASANVTTFVPESVALNSHSYNQGGLTGSNQNAWHWTAEAEL